MSEKKYTIPTGKEVRIAISGKSGCGNTTASTLLSDILAIPCINYTFKNLSAEMNLSFKEIVEKASSDFSYDKMVDSRQVELALSVPSCVLASRLAIWMLKNANLKVYLYASSKKRAERVHKREGGNFEEIEAFTKMRDEKDSKRYKALYSINNDEYGFADLVIDTDEKNPEQIVNIILMELEKRGLILK